jgi:hypothetical protein
MRWTGPARWMRLVRWMGGWLEMGLAKQTRTGEARWTVLCDATKKKLYFSADRFFMTKDNEVMFNEDFYLLYSTK